MHPFAFSDALPPDEDGMLLVKGPNVMRGYLGQLEKTKEVITDGWYHTGGVAAIDDDGFIHITDRLSRCSKIGGEMVPQIKVEETVSHVLGGNLAVATAVPDDRKGEPGVSREELSMRLAESGLPKLWMPKRESLYLVDEIPVPGSGKIDWKKIRTMALEISE